MNVTLLAQVTKEARRVAARLNRAEQQTLKQHATNHERLKLATMYSLGHKVCFALVRSQVQSPYVRAECEQDSPWFGGLMLSAKLVNSCCPCQLATGTVSLA